MKKLRSFVLCFLLVLFFAMGSNVVHAADWQLSFPRKILIPFSYVSSDGQYRMDDSTDNYGIMLFVLSKGGERNIVWCIQHGIWTDKGQYYDRNTFTDYWNSLGDSYKNNIRLAAYWFRNARGGNESDSFYADRAAVQMYIWQETLNAQRNDPGGRVDWDHIEYLCAHGGTKYQTPQYTHNAWNDLMAWMAEHPVKNADDYPVSFQYTGGGEDLGGNNFRISPGQVVTLRDTLGNFQDSGWTVDTTGLPEGIQAYKNGNDLNIVATDTFRGTWSGTVGVKFVTDNLDDGSQEYVFAGVGSSGTHAGQALQQLVCPGSIVSNSSRMDAVKVEAVSYKIRLVKKDSKNNSTTARGDATLAGARYLVTGPNNFSQTLTTSSSGTAETDWLQPGTYTIREVSPSTGYQLSSRVYTVEVANQTEIYIEQDVTEDIITGNVEIHKRLQNSDYDPEIDLKGTQFRLRLKSAIGTNRESEYTFYTNVSGNDGICRVEDLPYGTYEVEECVVPDEALKVDNFDVFVSEQDKTYKFTKVDTSKKMKIRVRKQDYDTDLYGKNHAGTYGWTQGDAKLKGAQYTIYRDKGLTDVVDTITIDHQDEDGYWCAESKYMWTGTYYVKETKRPEGYLIDENVYTFTKDNREQTVEHVLVKDSLENAGRSTDRVERGRVEVVKFDQNTDKDEKYPATGAKLWLVLNSSVPGGVEGKSSSQIAALSGLTYYEEIVNEDGYADFVDDIYRAEYPEDEYTIPYGTYTIIEVAGSEAGAKTHFFNKPQEVKVTRQGENKYYILGEEIIPMYLQIQKTDKDSGEDVQIGGAKYMVWDVARSKFVEQKFTPDGALVSVFETNPNGMITLPEKLDAGDYIVYEIEAPEGYYLDEEYRLPANKSDYGKIEKGGALFTIDKEALGVKPDSTGEKVDLYYKAEIANTPLKAKLQIVKTGEQFSGVTQTSVTYTNTYDITKPKFENKGLQGVTYEIYAAEDITSPDGNYVYVTAGTKVDTITTGEDGIAETKELYCGEYRIVETVTPKGYITDNNIPNVVLENEGPEKVKTTVKELSNIRQKLSVMIDKVFEDVKYSSSQEIEKEAVFGIYANQNFILSNGYTAIVKDTLVATTKVVDGVEQDTDSIDLPEGEYYVRELEASYPYTILDETKNVTLTYGSNEKEKLTFEAGEFINKPETATVTLIKLSTSTLKDVVLNGSEIDTSKLDEEVKELLEELSGMTVEEVKSYLQEKQVKFVAGAKYGVYIDEECTKPLYMENEDGQFEKAEMITDDTGLITMGKVPLGTYYFKEIEAPKGYELSKEVIKLELTLENKDAVVYQALIEEPVIGKFITKTDIFTGEVIPNCVFEVRDLEDNVLLHDKTDDKGVAYIPVDILVEGETYQFVEIEAPEIYDLNTEPHEFTAHFDENGNWDVEPIEVENTRKKSEVTFEKSDFADSTPIPNCKFELRSLETDFVVEGVTDEEGKYVFKDIPYGKYTYRELEAPEEYMIDTEEHEIVIDTEETTVKITNTKKPELPDTGDIAVYALGIVALVSVLGIVYVIKRNKKISE